MICADRSKGAIQIDVMDPAATASTVEQPKLSQALRQHRSMPHVTPVQTGDHGRELPENAIFTVLQAIEFGFALILVPGLHRGDAGFVRTLIRVSSELQSHSQSNSNPFSNSNSHFLKDFQ